MGGTLGLARCMRITAMFLLHRKLRAEMQQHDCIKSHEQVSKTLTSPLNIYERAVQQEQTSVSPSPLCVKFVVMF